LLANPDVEYVVIVVKKVSILVLVDLARECFYYKPYNSFRIVSILVLVDLAREFYFRQVISCRANLVSILVLVDLAREFMYQRSGMENVFRFNPCFSGSCSRISVKNVLS